MKAKQTQNARDKQSVSFAKSSSGIVSQFKEPQPIVIKGELQPASLHNLTCTRIRIPLNAASAAAFLSCFPLHIRISPTTQHFALNLPHIRSRSRIRILLCSQRVSYFILLHLHSTTATSPFVLFRSLPSLPLPHSHSHAPYPTLWLLPCWNVASTKFFLPSCFLSLPLSSHCTHIRFACVLHFLRLRLHMRLCVCGWVFANGNVLSVHACVCVRFHVQVCVYINTLLLLLLMFSHAR